MSLRLRPVYLLPLTAAALLARWSVADAQQMSLVTVRVTETSTQQALPCRLTVVDERGNLAEFAADKQPWLAYRPGVLYTGTGEARFSLPPGRYTLYANRGLEYSLVSRTIRSDGRPVRLDLKLEREVDTSGYIACDTHIHTLTHSGHGDSTLEERMATIAGEGIELAIATDHNHHVDYAPVARATRTDRHFTPVIGNEVTTSIGHFNAFPIRPGARVPNHRLPDWKSLLAEMRSTPGVRVVVLNHPSNNHGGYIPTAPERFHAGSGEDHEGKEWAFDGMEVLTSAAMQSDQMKPYRDWFALLNRGLRISGIGSSDTHDVNRFILGQGRTYIASRASRPDQIDVQEACNSIQSGKVLSSLGLLTEMWVDGKYGVGEFGPGTSPELRVRVRVQAPRWIAADRLDLYANGQKLLSRPIVHAKNAVVKLDQTFTLPRPKQDVWLVAVATGPGIREPYWPTPRPYQPDRAAWEPQVMGATNPIRVDGDGDGDYRSPLDYARAAVQQSSGDPEALVKLLTPYDEAVAVQAASVCREQGLDLNAAPFRRAVERAPEHVRHGFIAYQNLLPKK